MRLQAATLPDNKICRHIQEIINACDGLVVISSDNLDASKDFLDNITPSLIQQFERDQFFVANDDPRYFSSPYFAVLNLLRFGPDILIFRDEVLDDKLLKILCKMAFSMKIIMITNSIASRTSLQNLLDSNVKRPIELVLSNEVELIHDGSPIKIQEYKGVFRPRPSNF
ncbi:hypothetical protein ICN48_06425 [Polynucleobacter sp. JS-Safj-400b-B2]|uniref:hypothetical protein n=1 Tax=Polynucleobacter sp. JS-Safj-400b-B2 TaxID=2576921 RepID=UPI001C0B5A84|nr:hypothetical protein [Polynucleobacter sp. JS-Safj-400b-B2]MBU3625868.1 hypothetical protein [Polynucleobacter sp. JS-Safj-400b-B2]